MTKKEAEQAEREFADCYVALLEDPLVRSVGIDKGTTLWEVLRYAQFGSASMRARRSARG